jgi:serine/threonine protein kinase
MLIRYHLIHFQPHLEICCSRYSTCNCCAQMQLRNQAHGFCAGTRCEVSCTLCYAAPEVINAREDRAELTVEPSLDIWAIGVIVFECLAGCRVFGGHGAFEQVVEFAKGLQQYPWERPSKEIPKGWRRSRACSLFSSCLSRDPTVRPTAEQLLKGLHKLSNTTSVGAS